jgi:tetratricopeptide (TPR) repeat protein
MSGDLIIEVAVEEAERAAALDRVSESLPAEAGASFRQGLEWMSLGEAVEAARCFEQALERAPDFADGHVGLGMALAVSAQIYPALDHLETATRLEPGNFYAHFKLGQLYFKLRVPQKGYEQMRRALDCASSLGERRLVAQLLREEKQREKSAYQRPWWNKPFPRLVLVFGASGIMTLVIVLLAYLR